MGVFQQNHYLPNHLGTHSQEILSLVYAHCLDYQSLNSMPQWFERTDLNFLLNLEGLTEKRWLAALDSLETLDAQDVQRRLFESVCQRFRVKPSGVIYDVTNTYLYGKRCPLANNRVKAHVFVCYLAYLLLSVLQYRLRGLDLTAERVLEDLGTVYKVYLRDTKDRFQLSRVVTLSKHQENILKTINPALLKS